MRPEQNLSKKLNIDGPKYHPVRCPPKCGVSSDLPLMEPLIRTYREIGKIAYQALLLKDEGYEHRCLSVEYELDVTEQDVSALILDRSS